MNDEDVRKSAFSSSYISWEDHCRWFEAKLRSDDCFIYIALNESGEAVGQVRFDIVDTVAEIDFSLGKAFRGLGFGKKLVRLGTAKLLQETDVETIYAKIKADNTRSLKCFENSFFERQELENDSQDVAKYKATRTEVLRRP